MDRRIRSLNLRLSIFGKLNEQRNVFYGFGYSGNGVAQTRMGGKILSSMVLGLDNKWTRSGLAKGSLGHFLQSRFAGLAQ